MCGMDTDKVFASTCAYLSTYPLGREFVLKHYLSTCIFYGVSMEEECVSLNSCSLFWVMYRNPVHILEAPAKRKYISTSIQSY